MIHNSDGAKYILPVQVSLDNGLAFSDVEVDSKLISSHSSLIVFAPFEDLIVSPRLLDKTNLPSLTQLMISSPSRTFPPEPSYLCQVKGVFANGQLDAS